MSETNPGPDPTETAVFGAIGSITETDVGSLNGTYIDRERVESHLLTPGEEVQIGKFRLAYYPAVNFKQ